LLGAKAGDVVWYYKTDGDNEKGGVSINLKEVGIYKYKEMLKATVKDALEIPGYDTERIFNNNTGIIRDGSWDKR
jgi:hypothetical protein